ncbi:MAG: DNA-processing protein DprA [Candidatus Eutrophobiaceae bacterium]
MSKKNVSAAALWLNVAHAYISSPILRKVLAWDDPLELLKLSPSGLRQRGLPAKLHQIIHGIDRNLIDSALDWQCADDRHHIISWQDPDYPRLLREIAHPPVALYGRGFRTCLEDPQIAIVGSRQPDAYGCRVAAQFSSDLAKRGLTITSGLAIGIDGQAHCAALDAGGRTIAVLGNGLASVYPSRHRKLAERIAEQGLLLSEFPPDTPPLPAHFPQRNRIISGMSAGVLVIQATLRSGSLITARLALEQNREVFAVPGSVKNPLSQGCHHLIREGAKLVVDAEEVVEELGMLYAVDSPPLSPVISYNGSENPEEETLLQCMGFEPTDIDDLAQKTHLTSEKISSMLLSLELRNKIVSQKGGRYLRV